MTVRMCGLLASATAPPGVASTSTGPRFASSAISGVVRMTSPRKLVWITSDPLNQSSRGRGPFVLIHLEDGEKRFLRDLDRADLLHSLLSFFLLFEKLALARDVPTVAFGEYVLAQRLDARTRDDLVSDRRLNGNLEELARNQLLQLVGDLAPPLVRLVLVDDDAV